MKSVLVLGSLCGVLAVSAVPGAAQEMPQPTAEHERLKEDVGEWEAAMKVWMGPGEPMAAEGRETVFMVGPFWQVTRFEGTLMGQPFEGTGWTGWDPKQKKFVSAWIDSMTPTISHGFATWDAGAKAFKGSMTGMGPDGTPQEMETTVAYPEAGKRVFTMKVAGQTTMEITYTRK